MYSQTHVLTKQSSHIYIKKPQPKVMDPLSIFCIQETNIQQPILGHKNLGSDMDRLVRFGHNILCCHSIRSHAIYYFLN